jgi:tetratricopeptide (TPR) repeat protein
MDALTVARATPDRRGRLELLETARRDLSKALGLQPDALNIMARMADTYTAWGELVDPGKFADSIHWWQRMVDHDPTDIELKLAFDRAKGGMRAAMTQWEAAALARPDDPQRWVQVAKGYVGLGEGAQARPAVERALNLDAANIEARDLLAALP